MKEARHLELTDALTQYGGWAAGALASSAAWVTRMVLGRHIKRMDEIGRDIQSINLRLTRIEGRFDERDHA